MHVTFEHVDYEADHIGTFYFKPEKPLNYTAGQFIELTLPHVDTDDRRDKRWFTLSSSPTDELLSITTKFPATKPSSFKKALRNLKPGTEVSISDPMGDFVLPRLIQTPLIFVAAGIGVTPFHSILNWLAATGEQRPIRMLYAVDSEDDIIFQPTFDKAGQHVTVLVDRPSDAWGGERGKLTAEKILGLEQPSDDALVYVSGPEPIIEQLEKDLRKAGLKQHQLVLDFFPNYL